MPVRRADKITVESAGRLFDRFSRLEVVNDLAGPSEATFEIGDDGSMPQLTEVVAPGAELTVLLNGRKRLTGRAEVNVGNVSPDGGAVIHLTVRTRMSDARYCSADPQVRVKGLSLKQLVLAAYAQLGLAEEDFIFESTFAARDLMTGKSGSKGPDLSLEELKEDQAKVNPPESIFDFVERHLRRHGGTHWDAPDGRIVVGRPLVDQASTYKLQCKRGPAQKGNNVLRLQRAVDWSEVPSSVHMVAQTPGRDLVKTSMRGVAVDADVQAVANRNRHFFRKVIVPVQHAKDAAQVARLARRELSSRQRRKDAVDVDVDGWSFWDGSNQTPWAHDTIADVDFDVLDRRGRYLVHRVALRLDLGDAVTATLTLSEPALWVLE